MEENLSKKKYKSKKIIVLWCGNHFQSNNNLCNAVLTSTTNSDMTPDGGGHLSYTDSKWPMVSFPSIITVFDDKLIVLLLFCNNLREFIFRTWRSHLNKVSRMTLTNSFFVCALVIQLPKFISHFQFLKKKRNLSRM